MSYVYQALIMLPNEDRPSLDRIKEILQKLLALDPIARIKVQLDRAIVAIDDWQMSIQLQDSPHTIAAAQKIAELYLEEDDPRRLAIGNYSYHIEIDCQPDPQMNRFKYYVSVLDALANFPGAIIFNPLTNGFIEQLVIEDRSIGNY